MAERGRGGAPRRQAVGGRAPGRGPGNGRGLGGGPASVNGRGGSGAASSPSSPRGGAAPGPVAAAPQAVPAPEIPHGRGDPAGGRAVRRARGGRGPRGLLTNGFNPPSGPYGGQGSGNHIGNGMQ